MMGALRVTTLPLYAVSVAGYYPTTLAARRLDAIKAGYYPTTLRGVGGGPSVYQR